MLCAKIQLFPKFSAIFVGMMVGKGTTVKKWLTGAWLIIFCAMAVDGSMAQNNVSLLSQADGLFKRGMTEEARQVHEEIVRLDTACFESNVWVGNYYYLKGEEKRKQADDAYRSLPDPSRMQMAYYQEQLKAICLEYYLRADTMVQRALRQQLTDHLLSMAADIEAFKISLGLSVPPVKKKVNVFRLLRSTFSSNALL